MASFERADMSGFSGQAAIAGIGATEFSKDSGRSELRLALEAVMGALDDAGVEPSEVDGLVTFNVDSSPESEIARNIGADNVTYLAQAPYGGGAACAVVQHAAHAVISGAAKTVVCYRAFNERSGLRFGSPRRRMPSADPSPAEVQSGLYAPFGLITPAGQIALAARRYMHEYGATSEDFGRVAVIARDHAATNPKAWFYERPITLEDHQQSRIIVDPLRLLDCCQESDGGVAFVITATERARDLKQKPVLIKAAAQGMGPDQEQMTSYYRPSITGLPEMANVGRQLWSQSGLTVNDLQALILYDHFTPFVLPQLEALGFCKPGEARHLIKDGLLSRNGRWPTNTHGGQLGEAYIHGLNGIAEAVRQVRGQAVNQVANVEHVLVSAGTGVPTSGLILGQA
jgi:acetyl-CoA acetyltransferase